jgi:hypothetical protein
MDAEQLEFGFDEAGEVVAPVSSLYKKWIYEVIKDALDGKDEVLFDYQILMLQRTVVSSNLFKKCNKAFKQEVKELLSIPFEDMYKLIRGVPFAPEVGTNIKPKLKLVK